MYQLNNAYANKLDRKCTRCFKTTQSHDCQ